MNADCIFCKIVAGEIPGDFVLRNDRVSAFRDINAAAPTHVLIVPNEHIGTLNDLTDPETAAALLAAAREIAAAEGVSASGYRLIANNGPDGRQEVPHLHFHLLGGRRMKYPVG
ncbi:MAG: HIT domain-containing protein [Anaerolineales bacterium]